MFLKGEKMAKKATEPKKATPRKKVSKGESLVCEVCGLSVVVEEAGGYGYAEESAILCCGKPMKQKASKRKATKK
jgi:hypothetical protein